jgi:RNase P protein component
MSNIVPSVRLPMTSRRVRATIRELDAVIARSEAERRVLDRDEFRAVMALRERRVELHLLLVARRLELQKKVVSLNRWRYGYDAGRRADPAAARDAIGRQA